MVNQNTTDSSIVLGGGCFWCIEAVFQRVNGVKQAISGYAGGEENSATYHQVSSGLTGHAEVVKVIFDPNTISLREIYEIFFTLHDPTQKNGQGKDIGPQYRSVIFYQTEDQKELASEVIQEFEHKKVWNKSIVTEVKPLKGFYRAEDYHQSYYNKNPNQGYCRIIIKPKVAKLRQKYLSKLKSS